MCRNCVDGRIALVKFVYAKAREAVAPKIEEVIWMPYLRLSSLTASGDFYEMLLCRGAPVYPLESERIQIQK